MIASRKLDRLELTAKEMRKWLADNGRKNRLEFMVANIRKVDSVRNISKFTFKI